MVPWTLLWLTTWMTGRFALLLRPMLPALLLAVLAVGCGDDDGGGSDAAAVDAAAADAAGGSDGGGAADAGGDGDGGAVGFCPVTGYQPCGGDLVGAWAMVANCPESPDDIPCESPFDGEPLCTAPGNSVSC